MARAAAPTQAVLEALPLAYAIIKARQVSGHRASAVWLPQEGPQRIAYDSPADETLFGGSPGGGKTDWLLGLALTQHRRSVIFRREFAQVGAMIDRAVEIVGNDDGLNRSNSTWRFTDGRFVEWGGVQHEKDTLSKWRGRAHDLKAFDELTEFSETQYLTLSGWARTAVPGQRVRVVATCNPPESEDAAWIVKRWGPWVDPLHKEPAASGEVRWYATIDGTDTECEDGEPFEVGGETIRPRSRTFVRSWLSDNRYLSDTGYAAVIDALPEPLRTIMKSGDFTAAMNTVNPFQVIPSAWVRAAQARWTPERPEDPKTKRPVPQSCVALDVAEGGKDRTAIAQRYDEWVAPLTVKFGRETPTTESAVALLLPALLDGGYAVIDADGVGAAAYGMAREKLGAKVRAYRGVKPTFWRDRTAMLEFFNVRAAAWWAMRDALDPASGRHVALPPDPDLRAELCSARWEMRGPKIKLEDKDDIVSRLGRSPDLADAVVMSFWPGAAAELAESYGVKVGTG